MSGGYSGWMTLKDGSRVPLSSVEAERLLQQAEAEQAKRVADMPTEHDALRVMCDAYQRLKELGWNDAIYCPKDGSEFEVIEAGSFRHPSLRLSRRMAQRALVGFGG